MENSNPAGSSPDSDRGLFFKQLRDESSSTYTYILADEATRESIIIDPVLERLDEYIELVERERLKVRFILDTHVHADHVTAAGRLSEKLGAATCVSAAAGVECAGVQLGHGEILRAGHLEVEARQTPGHTSGCMTFVLAKEKVAFTGDALLIEGSGRTDFQQGNAHKLYESIHRQIFSLPDDTTLYPAHDYKGRTSTTVAHEKEKNPRLGGGRTADEFAEIMANLKLAYPKQIDRALPLNLQCGIENAVPLSESATPAAGGILEVSTRWVLDNKVRCRLVDVRESHELGGELSHIRGVEHVPLATVNEAAERWSRDDTVVTICRSGGRSGKAAKILDQIGFTNVASMQGGMIAWNKDGLPIVPSESDIENEGSCG